jgi:hypothetical protein
MMPWLLITAPKPRDQAALTNDAHWGIKLTKTTQYPILASFFIFSRNTHGGEQLLGNPYLALAMFSGKWLSNPKFP